MTDFNKVYLKLLKDQVEVEIKFLKSVGHNNIKITTQPCIWCICYKNTYVCNRLNELNQFLSEIVVKMNGKPLVPHSNDKFTEIDDLNSSSPDLLPENNKPF